MRRRALADEPVDQDVEQALAGPPSVDRRGAAAAGAGSGTGTTWVVKASTRCAARSSPAPAAGPRGGTAPETYAALNRTSGSVPNLR